MGTAGMSTLRVAASVVSLTIVPNLYGFWSFWDDSCALPFVEFENLNEESFNYMHITILWLNLWSGEEHCYECDKYENLIILGLYKQLHQ